MLRTVFLAAFLTAVSPGSPIAADAIKLGVAGAHSGDLASYGLPTVKAAEQVVNAINAKGGVLGKQVALLVEDDTFIKVARKYAEGVYTTGPRDTTKNPLAIGIGFSVYQVRKGVYVEVK